MTPWLLQAGDTAPVTFSAAVASARAGFAARALLAGARDLAMLAALARESLAGSLVLGHAPLAGAEALGDWLRAAAIPRLEAGSEAAALALLPAAEALSAEFAVPVVLSWPGRGEGALPPLLPLPPPPDPWLARQVALAAYADASPLNELDRGAGRRGRREQAFVALGGMGPVLRQRFPEAPILSLCLTSPLPLNALRGLIALGRQAWAVGPGADHLAALLYREGYALGSLGEAPGPVSPLPTPARVVLPPRCSAPWC